MDPRTNRMRTVVLVGRDPQHQPSLGTDAPSYHTKVDTPASGHGNFYAPYSSRGGLRYAPRESVDHHESPPVGLVVAETQGPAQPQGLHETLSDHERYLTELIKDVDYAYDRRNDLLSTVRRLRTDGETYR